jgi:hypothetical protein
MRVNDLGEPVCSHHYTSVRGGVGMTPRITTLAPTCHDCGRLCVSRVAGGAQCVTTPLGALSCGACSARAVHTSEDAYHATHEVAAWLDRIGLVLGPRVPEVRLADVRAPNLAPPPVLLPDGTISDERTETDGITVKHIDKFGWRTVPHIDILGGMAHTHARKVLAHELTHALLHLHDFPTDLPLDVEEGVCELVSYMWLSHRASDTSATAADRLDAAMWMKRMEHRDNDNAYGRGFHRAVNALRGRSLHELLSDVAEIKDFPPPKKLAR